MGRYLFACLVIFLAASPIGASTIELPFQMPPSEAATYIEVMEAHLQSYRDAPTTSHKAYAVAVSHSLALAFYALFIAMVLPRARRWRYPAWAAAAMSRMRWTMARNPLDRWDER